MRARLMLAGAVLLAPLALWTALPLHSGAASPSDRLDTIHKRLRSAEGRLNRREATARVLTTDIDAYNRRIDRLHGRIGEISGRVAQLDVRVRSEREQLEGIQRGLRAQRARAARLRARLTLVRGALADQLVELYKTDQPDIVTVVLNADGFADLLEQMSFMKRINASLRNTMIMVRTARAAAESAAARLAVAERRQGTIASQVQRHRNAVATAKQEPVVTQSGYARARSRKQDALRSVQASQAEINSEVRALQAAEARIQGQLRSAQSNNASSFSGATLPSGSGGGRMIWPVNGPITSQFCEVRSYEACHPGIDIGVPEGTAIRAAAAGKVILMQSVAQSGGYGNYTCIQHTQTMSSCYAHQSRFGTSLGASVAQGQVIGYVGNTGHSFGAHLHWEVRINGAVVNPANYV